MLDFLLYLGTWQQLVMVVLIFCPTSVVGLYLVRMWVPIETLKKNHEVAGFTFGVVGAFYGLFLAFVIVAAWERYDRADESLRREAIGLTELYRLGAGFQEPTRGILERSIRDYTRGIIEKDWPEMADNTYLTKRDMVGAMGLWRIVSDYTPADPHQQLLVDKSLDALSVISDARANRYMYYSENLPDMIWMVIYVGLFITVGFGYFFGLERFKSQALMCGVFSGLLGLTILAILELAHPYQGTQTISTFPLEYAVRRMNAIDQMSAGQLPGAKLGLSESPVRNARF
ncbi:MAG TPA: DUF4239 domain-containing protein [Candidatus Binataceae bacterium]|nr:DUF4239 domain-containing protein [Candidatus Binataceae bacterium]